MKIYSDSEESLDVSSSSEVAIDELELLSSFSQIFYLAGVTYV